MKRRIAYDRVRARFLRDEEASILKGLREIERRLTARKQEIRDLEARLAALDARLEILRARRAGSQARLSELRARAGRRAAAMLRLRRTSIARLVERVRNPVRARRLRDRFRYVLEHDRGMLAAAREADEGIRAAEAALALERQAREATKARLTEEIEETALLEAERAALAEAVRSERKAAERLVRELADAARLLEAEMGRLRGQAPAPEALPGGFSAQRGRLPWPTVGRVEVPFGKRVDPRSDVVLVSTGIDLRAASGTAVRAVFGGRVAYADWFDGFGRLLVLAHDGGFFTLYAHLESFAARAGARLQQHQVLGFVGDSGSTKGSYLYFEIRDGREPVDPLEWLVDDIKGMRRER